MTIENELKRIADALEAVVARGGTVVNVTPAAVEKTYAQERKAEVKAEAGRKAAGTDAKTTLKGPQTPKEKPAEKVPEPPVDDFLGEAPEPEKVVTLDEVRKAIVGYRAAKIAELGKEEGAKAAMALLAKHGGGATSLAGSAAGGTDAPGALQPEFYAAVLKAITG